MLFVIADCLVILIDNQIVFDQLVPEPRHLFVKVYDSVLHLSLEILKQLVVLLRKFIEID